MSFIGSETTVVITKDATASNVGAGSQVFKDLSGTTLRFRTLLAGSNISLTQATDTVTITSTASGTGNSYNPSGW